MEKENNFYPILDCECNNQKEIMHIYVGLLIEELLQKQICCRLCGKITKERN